MTKSQSTKALQLSVVFTSLVVLCCGSLASASDLKLGGFVDAQYQTRSFSNIGERNSFLVNDAAFSLGKEQGNANFFLELPFRGGLMNTTTINATTGVATTTPNANFAVGTTKAQAYVGYKYGNGLSWKMGQFEKLYGFEGNDTSDIAFTTQGLIHGFLPLTHDGLAGSYSFNKDAMFTAMVANHHDQGVVGTLKPDFGFKLSNAPSWYRASLGVLFEDRGSGEQALWDIMIGKTYGMMALDAEYVVKNLNGRTGWAALLNDSYAVTDMVNAVVRLEYEKKMAGVFQNEFELGVGPTAALSKELTAKADFYLLSQNDGVTTGTQKNFALSAVYKF